MQSKIQILLLLFIYCFIFVSFEASSMKSHNIIQIYIVNHLKFGFVPFDGVVIYMHTSESIYLYFLSPHNFFLLGITANEM